MTLRVAVIGSGEFARQHVLTLKAIQDVQVTHVVGSDLTRAQSLAGLIPGAAATRDAAAVLGDPSVDAVDICGWTPAHAPVTIAAGRAGKHVHVEKPAALSVADFDAMVAAVEGAGRTLMVGQTVRFQPAMAELERAVAEGAVGDPRLLHITWYVGHAWPGGWRAWQQDVTKSGGHPVHNGVHALDLATWLLRSEPRNVFGRDFPTFAPEMAMPDSFHLTVEFASGALATIELMYSLREQGAALRRTVLMGTAGTLTHDASDDLGLTAPGRPKPMASVEGALIRQLRHWAAAVRGEEEFVVRNDQVRATLAAAVAAQESLVTGHAIRIEGAR